MEKKTNPDLLLVGFGDSSAHLKKCGERGEKEGWRLSLIRPITLFPFPYNEVQEMAQKAGKSSRCRNEFGPDGRGCEIGREGKAPVHFYGRVGGMIPTVDEILQKIADILRGEGRK